MSEVPHRREDHGNAVLIGRLDHLFVPHAAARLDDGGDTGFSGGITVPEREKGVGGQRFPGWGAAPSGRQFGGVDPGSGRADTDGLVLAGEDDGVGLDVLELGAKSRLPFRGTRARLSVFLQSVALTMPRSRPAAAGRPPPPGRSRSGLVAQTAAVRWGLFIATGC